ncbi:MAG: hypothetical protein K1X89_05715 [Myxococcaceae bacterium]|nr:hypothetical protein [Myxococcaceae bacterium]
MRALPLLPLLASLACAPAGVTYHADVKPLLEGRCVNCHVAGGIAPFALDSYAQAKTYGASMVAATESGTMPPWRAGAADVHYLRDPSLTAAQKKVLSDWVNAGMPEGDAKAKPTVQLAPIGGGLDRTDLTLAMPEAYTPTQAPDDYRCFPLTWPQAQTMAVTGFDAEPGNTRMVHHIALYLVPPDAADLPHQWDQEEAGPGYSCFGGPFGKHDQSFAVQLITAWIPGYQGVSFPRGMGIEVPKGATVVLQLHYNVQDTKTQDLTKLHFKLEPKAQRRAAYQPYLNVAWVAGQMKIPAGQSEVVHQYQSDPRDFFRLLGSPLNLDNGFNLEAVMFHMHRLGVHGQLWLNKANGTSIKVLDVPAWDFHWQIEYYLDTPLRFEPGDKLHLSCTFDNSQARMQPGQQQLTDVNWGENSDEEMCVANILSTEP